MVYDNAHLICFYYYFPSICVVDICFNDEINLSLLGSYAVELIIYQIWVFTLCSPLWNLAKSSPTPKILNILTLHHMHYLKCVLLHIRTFKYI